MRQIKRHKVVTHSKTRQPRSVLREAVECSSNNSSSSRWLISQLQVRASPHRYSTCRSNRTVMRVKKREPVTNKKRSRSRNKMNSKRRMRQKEIKKKRLQLLMTSLSDLVIRS